MPNAFAYLMLLIWPLVTIWMFRRYPVQEALIGTIVAGYLLLPSRTQIDLPILPTYNKTFVPSFVALLICLLAHPERHRPPNRVRATSDMLPPTASDRIRPTPEMAGSSWLPQSPIGKLLLVALVFMPLITALQNLQPIYHVSGQVLPANTIYDGLSSVLQSLVMVIPMLLGRRYLDDDEGHRKLLWGLFIGGLIYSIPILFEVRFSPQLHTWIYGFFPHEFAQQRRFGGFRPVVFLVHGLPVALYIAMALAAGAALWRAAGADMRDRLRKPRAKLAIALIWMAIVLVLCKSFGAIGIAILIVPALLVMRQRGMLLVSLAVALLVLLYPASRGLHLIPVESLVAFVQDLSEERAHSLLFRINSEEILLDRAAERPLFGWGAWGRGLVYDEYYRMAAIPDGYWIIVIGRSGWVGYIATFGLITLPIFMLVRRRVQNISLYTSGLCLVLAINLLDLLPNSGITPLTWLIAGALLGRVERIPSGRMALTRAEQVTGPRACREPDGDRALRPESGIRARHGLAGRRTFLRGLHL